MGNRKAPHHRGPHQRLARQMNQAAYANPNTVCLGGCTCHARTILNCACGQACGRTLAQHKPGSTWTAGHRWDSQPATSTVDYRHEIKGCGSSAGATMGNRAREPHTPW